jgi:hypothetical protein
VVGLGLELLERGELDRPLGFRKPLGDGVTAEERLQP